MTYLWIYEVEIVINFLLLVFAYIGVNCNKYTEKPEINHMGRLHPSRNIFCTMPVR